MKPGRTLAALAILTASFFTGVAAKAELRYRILPIVGNDPELQIAVGDLNNLGQVAGSAQGPSGPRHAFRWRNGQFTDLHAVIAPDAESSAATSLNDRGTIVGQIDFSRGFRLRGMKVSAVTVVPGETSVSPRFINDRGQMVVESGGGAQQGVFFVDGDSAELLPGFPGGFLGLLALDLNDRGAVVGSAFLASGARHAALWQDGVLSDLGTPDGATGSIARGVNNFNAVVGDAIIGFGSAAATWKDGVWTILPSVPTSDGGSSAEAINDWGMIVGSGSNEISGVAALWFNGSAFVIADLVSDNDPLKPFVDLVSANFVNNRGDIVVVGFDSRDPLVSVRSYLLRLVDE